MMVARPGRRFGIVLVEERPGPFVDWEMFQSTEGRATRPPVDWEMSQSTEGRATRLSVDWEFLRLLSNQVVGSVFFGDWVDFLAIEEEQDGRTGASAPRGVWCVGNSDSWFPQQSFRNFCDVEFASHRMSVDMFKDDFWFVLE